MIATSLSMLIMVACAADPVSPPNPVGIWEGALDIRTIKLRLAFKIEKKEDGTLIAKMDSPDQGVKDIPMDEVKLDGNTLTIEFKAGKASYKGDIADDGQSIKGNWKQAG